MPGFFNVPALGVGPIQVARDFISLEEFNSLPPEDDNIYDFSVRPDTPVPPNDDCATSSLPYLCAASKAARNIFEGNFSNPISQAYDSAKTGAEDIGLRIGLGALGILTIVAGYYMLAGKATINVLSGGSGKTSDAVNNVKTVAKKGVTLAVTKSPAAAAAV